MPLFYVSLREVSDGEVLGGFVGGVFLNRPSGGKAAEGAAEIAATQFCGKHGFQALAIPVPVGESVPAEAIGRLIDLDELQRICGPLQEVDG